MIVAVRLALGIVRVDQKDRPVGSAGKGARLRIDGISKRLDRAPHFFARLRPDALLVVQNARDGDSGDPGSPRNVVNGGPANAHARRLATLFPNDNFGLSTDSIIALSRTCAGADQCNRALHGG